MQSCAMFCSAALGGNTHEFTNVALVALGLPMMEARAEMVDTDMVTEHVSFAVDDLGSRCMRR